MKSVSRVLALVVCGALSSASAACESSSTHSRCGHSYVTTTYWGASAAGGAAAIGGAWYIGPGAEDGPYGYGAWYDPGDDGYDPTTNSGGLVADPNAGDGSGWDAPDDGSTDPNADPGGDNGGDNGDGSGDGSGGGGDNSGGDGAGDSSGEGLKRLHLHDVSASPRTSPTSSASSSSSSPASRSASALAPGCYTCTMGCRTEAMSSPTGRQSVGLSDTSTDEACNSAVRTLAAWSHDTLRERLASCQQIVTASQ